MFFPRTAREAYFGLLEVRPLCAGCEFLRECREYAIRYDVQGFWGGMSQTERKAERKRLGIVAIKITATEAGMLRSLLEEIDDGTEPAHKLAMQLGCATDTVIRIRRRRAVAA